MSCLKLLDVSYQNKMKSNIKYLIIGVIIVILILINLALIFDWGRSSDVSASNRGSEIIVDSPKVDSVISNKVKISGKAKGSWFFEAVFPIELQDPEGNIIATSTATAEGDWTTESFVPFTASLSFSVPTTTGYGIIVLKNDNPSGDPSKSKTLEIPVSFFK